MNQLFHIQDIQTVHDLIEKSYHEPVLLFKHSSTCPVSSFAFLQLMSSLEGYTGHLESAMVVVQQVRDASNQIADRLQVQHQSPQAILVQDGAAVWHDSHNRLTVKNFEEAVKKHEFFSADIKCRVII